MQVRIIATDNGKHSDAKLAVAAANHIVQIGADASGQIAEDGRRLHAQIADVLEPVFRDIADAAHLGIQQNGTAHLVVGLEPHTDIAQQAVSDVCRCIAMSPFSSWFPTDTTADMVQQVVGQYLHIAQHMHCDWFARSGLTGHGRALCPAVNYDPDCPHVQRWIAIHTGGDPQALHEHALLLAGEAA